jgi:glutamate--cysteine ligase regulatory subunit
MEAIARLESLEVHTGNIHVGGKAKVPSTSTSKDLVKSIVKTMKSKTTSYQGSLVKSETCRQLSDEEVSHSSFTVKIFLLQWEPQYVKEALKGMFDEFGLKSVDYIIIQFPPPVVGGEIPLDKVKHVWKTVEDVVRAGSAPVAGTADLNKGQLEALHTWADIKPSINQVNLEACCEIPPDLVKYSKESDIRLYSHNDDSGILPKEVFVQSLEGAGVAKDVASTWEPVWAVKYTSQIKTRNVLGHRGFIVGGRRH